MKYKIEQEIAVHQRVILINFSELVKTEDAMLFVQGDFTQSVRKRLHELEQIIGEQHSRLAQIRALRWVLKQTKKGESKCDLCDVQIPDGTPALAITEWRGDEDPREWEHNYGKVIA